ncbi:MAG: hypothetical protein ABI119_05950 [Gemmatimonadaceae bacterium]
MIKRKVPLKNTTTPVSPLITSADFDSARTAWRNAAKRRWWGLLEAPYDPDRPAPVLPKQTEVRG